MNNKILIALLLFVGISSMGNSQITLIEENFQTEIPSTWTLVDQDGLTPALSDPDFSNAWIYYASSGDTCAASTSYYDTTGQSADFLISPKINLGTYNKFVWSAKSLDASYPENYVVLISTTDSLVASFTDTLHYEIEEFPYWETHTIQLDTLGYANQDVYIAIKNISIDKFILLIDDFKVSTSENLGEVEFDNELMIYPNPAQDYIKITMNGAIIGVQVLSMNGQVIAQGDDSLIDVSHLEAGQYLIRINGENGSFTQKFIKE